MNPPSSGKTTAQEKAALHHQEAIKLAGAGKLKAAVSHFEDAARLEPSNPVWHYNCGLAWQQLNAFPQAIAAYQNAVRLAPDLFNAWNNLSSALKSAGQHELAVEAGRCAVQLRPQVAGAHLNLGNALKAHNQFAQAEASYRTALALDPADPRIYLNLANVLRELGRIDQAMPLFHQAVQRRPDFAEAHRDLAFALFLTGNLRAGWAENEWRWKTEEMSKLRRHTEHPTWQGEDLRGQTLLAYTEQGFGDAIQFARYVKMAADLGARVVLECQPPLRRLFGTLEGVAQLVARGEALPTFDFQLPLLSFPKIFGTSLDSIPNKVPYLKPPATPAFDDLANDPRLRVGLVWAGNPSHQNDANRSIALDALLPLFIGESRAFYSLQIGERSKDIQRLGQTLINLAPRLTDFADTAAAIGQLDLVIAVDTAVAHLSGALGKATWLLLPFAPDWRWLLDRCDSPWYPTMRLFRQSKPGDWNSVVEKMAAELALLHR